MSESITLRCVKCNQPHEVPWRHHTAGGGKFAGPSICDACLNEGKSAVDDIRQAVDDILKRKARSK